MKKYVIIDLEWTSWAENFNKKRNSFKKRKNWQKKEIIQVGAIQFNKNYKILKKFNIYIKPKYNPILSTYIVKLTGITQKIIEKKGIKFTQAYKIIKKVCKDCEIFCNGNDNEIMQTNLLYNNLKDKNFKIKNIKPILYTKYKIPKKFINSPVIHTFFGYKLKKTKMHNAVYDCMNILKVIKKIKFI